MTPSASPAQVKSDPKTPAPALGTPSESHGAVVPAVMDVNAPKVEQNAQGVCNLPQHRGDPSSATPAPTSAAISPNTPLFDEQQVRRFHEPF